ncbi:MAG: hypothetical protein RMJ56_09770 [Gemmataceae bacterium]|nr:hypothetical protein [Gemmata sp.]MDW8197877.1 hypothetical protein [Gemmataceae bacterium]
MKPRLGWIGGAVLFTLTAGCVNDGEFSVRKALGWDDEPPRGLVSVPKNLPPASLEAAERVQLLGRQILAQNTFTGIEPLFMTIGVKDAVLFHVGTEQLWISEGLVEKCGTDAELAAVLCWELGQMVAEKRAARRLGRDVDPIPDIRPGTAAATPGGSAYDAGQQANLAFHERQFPRGAKTPAPDAAAIARELLQGAGYSVAELDRVEPLLKPSERGEKLRKQLGGTTPPPQWEK